MKRSHLAMSGSAQDIFARLDHCMDRVLPIFRKKELANVLQAFGLPRTGTKDVLFKRVQDLGRSCRSVPDSIGQFCETIEREQTLMVQDKRRPSARHSSHGSDRYSTPPLAAHGRTFESSSTYSPPSYSGVPASGEHNDSSHTKTPKSSDCIVCGLYSHDQVQCVSCGRYSHQACFQTSKLEMRVNGGFTCVECCARQCDPFFEIIETIHPTPLALRRAYNSNQQVARVSFKLLHSQLNEINMSRPRGGQPGSMSIIVRAFKLSATSRHADHSWPKGTKLFVNGHQHVTRQRKFNSFDNKWKGFSEPADITLSCRSGRNTIDLHTSDDLEDKYGMIVQICRFRTDDDIINEIAAKPSPSIEEGYRRALSSFQEDSEPDLVVTHTNLSLKCPLSLSQIGVPGRGLRCTHLQCFDIQSFVSMNRRPSVGRWRCGVCGSVLRPTDLIKDQWMEDMIRRAPFGTVDIKINQDGTWQPLDEDAKPLAPPRSLTRRLEAVSRGPDVEDVKLPPEPSAVRLKSESTDEVQVNGVGVEGNGRMNGFDRDFYPADKGFTRVVEKGAKASSTDSHNGLVHEPVRPAVESAGKKSKSKTDVVDLTLSSDEEDAGREMIGGPVAAQAGTARSLAEYSQHQNDPLPRPRSPGPDLYGPPQPPALNGSNGSVENNSSAGSGGLSLNEPAFDAFLDSILQE